MQIFRKRKGRIPGLGSLNPLFFAAGTLSSVKNRKIGINLKNFQKNPEKQGGTPSKILRNVVQ